MTGIGFLGCAHVHADTYADELPAAGGLPRAVFDHQPDRARAFALRHGLAVAESPEQLCAMVDGVIVAAEHVRFPELVAVAAAHGTPVLCEKPLGVSEQAAAAILDSGAWVSMALPVRYAPAVRQAKAAIDAGGLGPLVAVSGTNHGAFPGGFFGDRQASGGGAIIDHVVHLADALRFLTGCEFETVYAESSSLHGVGDVEDSAQVVATTRQGAWVSIDPSWSRPAGMAGANDLRMTLWFEHGQLKIDAFARHGVLVRGGGWTSHQPYGAGMDAALLADWVRAVRTGAPPPIPMQDGWKATQLALAALESTATGAVVRIPAQEGTST